MVLEHINLVLDELWWPKLTSTHLISYIYLLGCSFYLIQFMFLECILYIDRILNNIDWVKFLLWKDGHGFMCLKLMFIYLSLCHWNQMSFVYIYLPNSTWYHHSNTEFNWECYWFWFWILLVFLFVPFCLYDVCMCIFCGHCKSFWLNTLCLYCVVMLCMLKWSKMVNISLEVNSIVDKRLGSYFK